MQRSGLRYEFSLRYLCVKMQLILDIHVFKIGCSVAAAVPFHGQPLGQLQSEVNGRSEVGNSLRTFQLSLISPSSLWQQRRSGREEVPLERVLKALTILGLFGSYGSMASPVLNR